MVYFFYVKAFFFSKNKKTFVKGFVVTIVWVLFSVVRRKAKDVNGHKQIQRKKKIEISQLVFKRIIWIRIIIPRKGGRRIAYP